MPASLKLVVALLAVAGVAGASWLQIHRLRASRPRVWTEAVRERDVQVTITVAGAARWGRETTLSSADDGRVRAVMVEVGQPVREGQLLVVMDDRLARLSLDRARAAVAIAAAAVRRAEADGDRLHAGSEVSRLSFRRAERLSAAGTASDEALARSRHEARQAELAHVAALEAVEGARARLASAEADRHDADSRLSRRLVRAPADGVVTAILAQQGQPVHAGGANMPPSRLLTLVPPAVTDVEVPLGIDAAARVRGGARASVDVPALGEQGLEAHVVGVSGGVAEEVLGVRVRLETPPPRLRAGMSAIVHLTAASLYALAVPNHSVVAARGGSPAAFDGRCILAGCVAPPSNIPDILGRRALPARRLARLGATRDFHHGLRVQPGAAGVWTVRDGAIALIPIVLGLRGDFYSEVLAGVRPGTLVVTGPAALVRTLGSGDKAVAVPAPVRAP